MLRVQTALELETLKLQLLSFLHTPSEEQSLNQLARESPAGNISFLSGLVEHRTT